MSDSPEPVTSPSLAEEKARLIARLEKIEQLEKLAGELGVTIGGNIGTGAAVLPPSPTSFDGTIAGLINSYRTDARSPFRNLKYGIQNHYAGALNRISSDFGTYRVADMSA